MIRDVNRILVTIVIMDTMIDEIVMPQADWGSPAEYMNRKSWEWAY